MRVTKVIMSQVHSAHTHRLLRKWSSAGTANSRRDPQRARSLRRTGYRGKTVRTRPARCVCPRASTRTPWWTGTDPWVTAEPAWAGRALHLPHMSPFFSSSGCCSLLSFLQRLSCPTMLTCNRVTLYTVTWLVLVFSLRPALMRSSNTVFVNW